MMIKKLIYNKYNFIKSWLKLSFCKKRGFSTNNVSKQIDLEEIFTNKEINKIFINDEKIIDETRIPELMGGVNKGDRKAIYFLISFLKPKKILEVGTHIGSSTLSIALAAKKYNGKIDTIDIIDVNNKDLQYWSRFKSENSPEMNLKKSQCDQYVNFVTSNSINYLKNTEKKYDFIFLDGSHNSNQVYIEVSYSLNLLEKNGVILLHDYFPNGKIIWEETKKVIYGPYLALDRISKEGNDLKVLPLSNLPWETKFKSNKSSLAILFK